MKEFENSVFVSIFLNTFTLNSRATTTELNFFKNQIIVNWSSPVEASVTIGIEHKKKRATLMSSILFVIFNV